MVLRQACSHEDYIKAFVRWENNLSIWHRRELSSFLMLGIAVILTAGIPIYRLWSVTFFIPGLLILLALMGSFYFWKLKPKEIEQWGQSTFQENALLGLSTQYFFYFEGVFFQNDYEEVREYWSDFEKCVEDDQYFILSGGMERGLLILCKKEMTKQEFIKVRQCLRQAFGPRYFKNKIDKK